LKKGALGGRATLVVEGWNVDPEAAPVQIARQTTK